MKVVLRNFTTYFSCLGAAGSETFQMNTVWEVIIAVIKSKNLFFVNSGVS
jgi:hypothetical protein